MSKKTVTRVDGIRTVGVPVTDQDRALTFYLDQLGLEMRMDHPFGNSIRWIEVALHAGLQAGGVDVDPEILRWPGVPPMFAFRDPDGNSLEIVEGG